MGMKGDQNGFSSGLFGKVAEPLQDHLMPYMDPVK
jgi:hypothetical protein